ncbi:MAG: SiaB family protein kinase [Flavobacteriales bacterium]|nr:SiaB family protein kinase [Flavobacteriales bacterium]
MTETTGSEAHDGFINWYESLQSNNILFMFKGDFNQELVNSIVKVVNGLADMSDENVLVKNRMTGTIIECLQNICRHGESPEKGSLLKPGIILLRKTENDYVLDIGNSLRTKEVVPLREYIDKVNGMDDDDLRTFHKDVLVKTELFGKFGADLGLINVARKAKRGFRYAFREISDLYSFFSLEIAISGAIDKDKVN